MNRVELPGVDGSNPLGFLAALGLLRCVAGARLGFVADGSFRAFLERRDLCEADLVRLVANDAMAAADTRAPWRFTYVKAATKKAGPQPVADLKPRPEVFRRFLRACVDAWCEGDGEAAEYAAAYATDVAVDGKANTKPTAFHFTAANQTFLGTVETTRSRVTEDWVHASLFEGRAARAGSNLRWDPNADRNWALMANNPNDDGTTVDAPLEWLAFRGLPLLPSFPVGRTIITASVSKRSGTTRFVWPLWSIPSTVGTVRSLVHLDWMNLSLPESADPGQLERGVFAVCASVIRRTGQGFGNFSPATIVG
jgi:hypothetical protein